MATLTISNRIWPCWPLVSAPRRALTLEGGVGWLYQKSDGNQSIDKNTYLEYYLQGVWKMAPSVYLIPEVGYRDFGNLEFSAPNIDDKTSAACSTRVPSGRSTSDLNSAMPNLNT